MQGIPPPSGRPSGRVVGTVGGYEKSELERELDQITQEIQNPLNFGLDSRYTPPARRPSGQDRSFAQGSPHVFSGPGPPSGLESSAEFSSAEFGGDYGPPSYSPARGVAVGEAKFVDDTEDLRAFAGKRKGKGGLASLDALGAQGAVFPPDVESMRRAGRAELLQEAAEMSEAVDPALWRDPSRMEVGARRGRFARLVTCIAPPMAPKQLRDACPGGHLSLQQAHAPVYRHTHTVSPTAAVPEYPNPPRARRCSTRKRSRGSSTCCRLPHRLAWDPPTHTHTHTYMPHTGAPHINVRGHVRTPLLTPTTHCARAPLPGRLLVPLLWLESCVILLFLFLQVPLPIDPSSSCLPWMLPWMLSSLQVDTASLRQPHTHLHMTHVPPPQLIFALAISCLPYGFGMLVRAMLEDPTRGGAMKLERLCEARWAFRSPEGRVGSRAGGWCCVSLFGIAASNVSVWCGCGCGCGRVCGGRAETDVACVHAYAYYAPRRLSSCGACCACCYGASSTVCCSMPSSRCTSG